MAIRPKKGVIVKGLKYSMLRPLRIYDLLCQASGVVPVITDGVANRKGKSLHPDGHAVDLRFSEFKTPSKAAELFKFVVGGGYDVIWYPGTGHVHVEYQRELDMNRTLEGFYEFGEGLE